MLLLLPMRLFQIPGVEHPTGMVLPTLCSYHWHYTCANIGNPGCRGHFPNFQFSCKCGGLSPMSYCPFSIPTLEEQKGQGCTKVVERKLGCSGSHVSGVVGWHVRVQILGLSPWEGHLILVYSKEHIGPTKLQPHSNRLTPLLLEARGPILSNKINPIRKIPTILLEAPEALVLHLVKKKKIQCCAPGYSCLTNSCSVSVGNVGIWK